MIMHRMFVCESMSKKRVEYAYKGRVTSALILQLMKYMTLLTRFQYI